eukprot:scaffold133_cov169-Amphora_coffeaeformis.AAC.5
MEALLYQELLRLSRLEQEQRQEALQRELQRLQQHVAAAPPIAAAFSQVNPTPVSTTTTPMPPSTNGQQYTPEQQQRRSTYRDYSQLMPPLGHHDPTSLSQSMNFAERLHHLLSHRPDLESIIEWRPHGRAFKLRAFRTRPTRAWL